LVIAPTVEKAAYYFGLSAINGGYLRLVVQILSVTPQTSLEHLRQYIG